MVEGFSGKRGLRKIAATALAVLLAAAALLAWMYCLATSDPVVRTTTVEVTDLPRPLRLVLMSDIHVGGPDMPPGRVARIVGQVNALRPDVILIAGDFVSDKRTSTRRYSVTDAVAPLRRLRSRFGTVAVLGNHDHWRDAAVTRVQIARAGIRLLDNDATPVGPLTIGGVDDPFTGNDDLPRAIQHMRNKPGPRILLSHSPDVFPRMPREIALTLAGHTHCGQIRLPLVGAISSMSEYGNQYACGRIDEHGHTLIVSAGLGTSLLPLRLGAPPDVWLVELRPMARSS